MGDYRLVSCCESGSNVDELLDVYSKKGDEIIGMAAENPVGLANKIWSPKDGLLSNDPNCMYNMGKKDVYTSYICPLCDNMAFLMDRGKDKVGVDQMIECGEEVGCTFKVIPVKIGRLASDIDNKDKESAQAFLKEHESMLQCGSQKVGGLNFLKSDTFTNNMLVWWIIDRIFKGEELPHSLPLRTGFVCRKNGFLMINTPTIGNYSKLLEMAESEKWDRKEICFSIFNQLGVMLDVLKNRYFSHGNPSTSVLLFSEEEIEYEYKGLYVYSSFAMHIVDFSYSSITHGKARLYPKTENNKLILNSGNLKIDIENVGGSLMFKISGRTDTTFHYIRHAGLPIYAGAFDFYCFLLSLMLDKYFYDTVQSDDKLRMLWTSLWKEDDLKVIDMRLNKFRGMKPVIHSLLNGLWLRCDVLEFWLAKLKPLSKN